MTRRLPRDKTQILVEAYKVEPRPSREKCKELAVKSGLQVQQVIGWFTKCRQRGLPKQVAFTETQLSGLLQFGHQYGFKPSKEKMTELANSLGLTYKRVLRWFDYQRLRSGTVSNPRHFTATGECVLANSTVSSPKQHVLPRKTTSTYSKSFPRTARKTSFPTDHLNQNSSNLFQSPSFKNSSVIKAKIDNINQLSNKSNRENPKQSDMLQTKMNSLEQTFDAMKINIISMNQRFINSLETNMLSLNQQFNTLHNKIASVNESISSQQTQLGEIAQVMRELCPQVNAIDPQSSCTPNKSVILPAGINAKFEPHTQYK